MLEFVSSVATMGVILVRILYIDIDTLRPDHLGCYGYHRNTSPTIDWIASEGVRFERCHVSDAPCLPSRTALVTGRFGIHTGVVAHHGRAADPIPIGAKRQFSITSGFEPWFTMLQRAGFYTVSISPFPQRHAAWWFVGGLREWINTGKNGVERADEVNAFAVEWLKRNAERDNWFLHVNYWDPHTPYRTPEEYGNPFEDDPPPDWLTEEILRQHWEGIGMRSAQDCWSWWAAPPSSRMPSSISNLGDWKRWIDGYDTGIKYADDHVRQLLDILDEKGVLDETVIIVSSDHGENQGELNFYGDHFTSDFITTRVPLIVRFPGITDAQKGRVDRALHYQFDFAATLLELLGVKVPDRWDAKSFADAFREGREQGRQFLVCSQMAYTCQRGVMFENWVLIRTYHAQLSDLPDIMLFDIVNDPHELNNMVNERPEIVERGLALLQQWHDEMMSTAIEPIDPLLIVLREGGPFDARTQWQRYCERLRETGRERYIPMIEARFKK